MASWLSPRLFSGLALLPLFSWALHFKLLSTLEFSTCHCPPGSRRCDSSFHVIATLGGQMDGLAPLLSLPRETQTFSQTPHCASTVVGV